MTTEIAILNKHAVALAADSAVTSGDKVFQTGNKIFALSKFHPVGIMVYSSAEYCGIPWETIIKEYRRNYDNVKFKHLHSYARHFVKFLQLNKSLNKSKLNDEAIVLFIALRFAEEIQQNIYNIANELSFDGKIDKNELFFKIREYIVNMFSDIINSKQLKIYNYINFTCFVNKYASKINDVYQQYKISKYEEFVPELKLMFIESIYSLLTTDNFSYGYSGIVFAGFGADDLLPRLFSYKIGFSLENRIQLCIERDVVIDNNNSVSLNSFAQGDIVNLFMDGLHPDMQNLISSTFLSILSEYSKLLFEVLKISKSKYDALNNTVSQINADIVNRLMNSIDLMKYKFWSPTINTINNMVPIEIANLAEALVNITSMHRKVAYLRETVGGPTDVALITKGDGFVWIKRKHYFDPQFNPYFFMRNSNGDHYEKK